MNSIGLWYEQKTQANTQKTEIHINICKMRDYSEYIEFGILMYDYEKDWGELNISMPFEVNEIEDLSTKLHDASLISALFNEKLSVGEKSKFFTVKMDSVGKIKFKVMSIDSRDLKYEVQDNHTIVKIKISNQLINTGETNTTIYVRFRIQKIGNMFQNAFINTMLLDGYIEKKGIFEVNVNMVRKLPEKIRENLKNSLNIHAVNLFFITDYDTDILFESKNRNSVRILENHIWEDYVGYKNIDVEKVIAYQWKSNLAKEINDFNIFVKTLIRIKNSKTWFLVMLFMLIFGIIGGVGGNYITVKCFNGFDSNTSLHKKILKDMVNEYKFRY